MPIPSPPILDSRYDDVAARTEKLAVALTKTKDAAGNPVPGWVPPPDGGMDLGRALIRVFERMARQAMERINRVPDRSFLAFLDRTGVSPSEARAARVPLTFSLVARGDAEPTVPAGTRVGAAALPTDAREIVFETERDLRTTRARLTAVIVRQPDGDRLSDRTAIASSGATGFFDAFDGGDGATHALYLAADDVLGLPAGTLVTAAFTVSEPAKWQALHDPVNLPQLTGDPYYNTHKPTKAPLLVWSYHDGSAWTPLAVTPSPTGFTFTLPANVAAVKVHGRTARWIRGQLLAWPQAGIPTLTAAALSGPVTKPAAPPDAALSNGAAIDLSLDFFPFGEQPKLNSSLVLACDAAMSRPGASVTVSIALNAGTLPLKATDAPALTWEISTGAGWKRVLAADVTPSAPTTNDVLRTATFTVPPEAAPKTIGNTKAVWLRIRLSSGSFGKGLSVDYGQSPPKTTDDAYRPPIVRSITVASSVTITNAAPLCATDDDFALTDRAPPAAAKPLVPFTRSADGASLHLGFNRGFTPTDTYLYFEVAPLDPVSAAKEASAAASGNVAWDYWSSAAAWKPLVCEDETRAFATSGVLRFVAPPDLARRPLFGRDLFWIRARYSLPQSLAALPPAQQPASPRLGRVLTNTVWARDGLGRTGEILGSADGREGQSFTLAARPVLGGEVIQVRESGDDWVTWHEVTDFYSSAPEDRHYTLDRAAGVLRFGDGRRGMAPPRGTRNVRAAWYATGGGADGNRPAHSVEAMKTTVPYVDSVTNHEPATGGAAADTADDVKVWGPSVLRHGYRAVTAQDFEDLALEASPAVARARALTPGFDAILAADNPAAAATGLPTPGGVVLLLAATGPDLPPAASTGLLRNVDTYVRARAGSAVSLKIAGPTWIEVRVDRLVVTASSPSGLEALRDRIERALRAFFHPTTGNTDGAGWAFGKLPHESDVHRLVTSMPGVDRVGVLAWTMQTTDGKPAPAQSDPALARVLVYPGTQHVEILAPGGT